MGMSGTNIVTLIRLMIAALLATLSPTLAAAPAQAKPASAEAFLRRLYAPYIAGDTKVDLLGAPATTIFTPPLLRLIRQDQAVPDGEVGALNFDPFCNCQDFDRLTRFSVVVRPQGPGRATGTVRFVNQTTSETITFRLVRTGVRWRIADIGSKDMPSLVALLTSAFADRPPG